MKRSLSWKEQRRLIKRLINKMNLLSNIAIQDRVIGCLDKSFAAVIVKDKKYRLEKREIVWAIDVFVRWFKIYSLTPPKRIMFSARPAKDERIIEFEY